MPCYDPTQKERDLQTERTARAIVIFDRKMGIQTDGKILKMANAYSIHGDLCNNLTSLLCAKIRALSEEQLEKILYNGRDRGTVFLVKWWDEHDAFDKERGEI